MEKQTTRSTPIRASMTPTNPPPRLSLSNLPRTYEELFRQSLDRRGRVVSAEDMTV
jgi:hypothetical protein